MVKVNKEICIGCGTCPGICPEVFEMKDDGKAHVKSGAKPDEKCIKEAITSCPVGAISE